MCLPRGPFSYEPISFKITQLFRSNPSRDIEVQMWNFITMFTRPFIRLSNKNTILNKASDFCNGRLISLVSRPNFSSLIMYWQSSSMKNNVPETKEICSIKISPMRKTLECCNTGRARLLARKKHGCQRESAFIEAISHRNLRLNVCRRGAELSYLIGIDIFVIRLWSRWVVNSFNNVCWIGSSV